jgi:hypothetical protein
MSRMRIELTFKLDITEDALDEVRRLQETADFGSDEALILLRDNAPYADLINVEDNN